MSTWMVVEDEPDIYEVLLAMFEMWGIDGVAFVDGDEAVAWIDDVDSGRYRGELPELALLDIRLPGAVSGPQVGERLRKSTVLGNVAIVLSTAYKLSPEEEEKVIEQAGADKLMYKPLPKFNELEKQLEEVIANRREIAATEAQPKAPAVEVVVSEEPVEKPVKPKPKGKKSNKSNKKSNN